MSMQDWFRDRGARADWSVVFVFAAGFTEVMAGFAATGEKANGGYLLSIINLLVAIWLEIRGQKK